MAGLLAHMLVARSSHGAKRTTVTVRLSNLLMFTVAGTAPGFHGVPFSSRLVYREPIAVQVYRTYVN